jgi:Tfp pilus assembly PilM family ATPase
MRELLGDDAAQVSYDFWVTEASQTTTMHLAWTPRDLVTEVAEGLRRSRWRVKAIDLPVAALARLGQFSDRPESQLIVDVSHADANFVWSKFGEPNYLRTRISLGGQPPTAILAARRQISLAAAETSLERWGLQSHDMPSLTELHEACLNDWLDRLSYEIQRTLQFIHAGQPTETRPGVLLCGDAGDIRGIAEWLGRHLQANVDAVEPGDHATWTSAQPYRRTYAMALSNSRPGVAQ